MYLQMSPTRSPTSTGPTNRRFPGGLTLATTDLDDINLDDVDQSLRQPLKRLAPTPPTSNQPPPPLPLLPPSPRLYHTSSHRPPSPRAQLPMQPSPRPGPQRPPSPPATRVPPSTIGRSRQPPAPPLFSSRGLSSSQPPPRHHLLPSTTTASPSTTTSTPAHGGQVPRTVTQLSPLLKLIRTGKQVWGQWLPPERRLPLRHSQ
ncbi:extensin-like [Puntigrus tetrazona]|uniref:extensin-like n=1 Tax=Puntigrus tetrazona TaxID=1606681 RepID=UPI001C891DD3|nr:extensin-like [Puntigrus tetrazona]